MSLARLQRDARVAQFAAQKQALQIDQRFVDHHGLDLGRPVHAILGIGPQIAVRGLLDVLEPREGRRRTLADLCQKIEHVIDVGAFLVEIGRVVPGRAAAGGLGLGRHALDRQHPLDVPGQIVAGQLDLQMRQAVEGDPLGSVSGRPSLIRMADVGVG